MWPSAIRTDIPAGDQDLVFCCDEYLFVIQADVARVASIFFRGLIQAFLFYEPDEEEKEDECYQRLI